MQGTSGAATATGLKVSGPNLTRNGVQFVPRGFTMIGALAGPGCTSPDTALAQSYFNAAELATLAGTWHANTVRFQVSQRALSDPDPALVTQYLATVAQAVGFARAAGLVVILSMQDQPLSCGPGHDFPSAETQSAWDALAPVYSGAPDVMYELFNEPHDVNTVKPPPLLPLSAASWAQWLNGGSAPDPDRGGTVGHQQLLQHVRGLGVRNVILADGLNWAGVLPGPNQLAPLLRDTMKPANLAYSVHPYYFESNLADWEFRFGALSGSVPVVATEWNYKVSDCGTKKKDMAPGFLTYLSDRGIGVLGMGADLKVGLTLMADWTYAPTFCGAGPDGPGAAFRNYLAATQTPRPTTLSLLATLPVVVGDPMPVTGTLLINGAAPSIGMALAVTRKVGTVTTKLPSLVTGVGGSFAFDGGVATAPGKVKLTVKYAGNGVTRAASATVTVLVTG